MDWRGAYRRGGNLRHTVAVVSEVQRFIIALYALTMFGAMGGYLVYKGTSESTVNIIVGALIGYAGGAITYYLGSSKGSTEKDRVLSDIASAAPPAAAAVAPQAAGTSTTTVTSAPPAETLVTTTKKEETP